MVTPMPAGPSPAVGRSDDHRRQQDGDCPALLDHRDCRCGSAKPERAGRAEADGGPDNDLRRGK